MATKVKTALGPVDPSRCNRKTRALKLDWHSASGVEVEVISTVGVDGSFGVESPRMVGTPSKLSKHGVGPIPLKFVDKQTVALTINDVFVEGAGGTMYTDCEVYAVVGINSDIPRDYTGRADTTVKSSHPVVSLIHPSISNYYHWTAESATRLLLSIDYFIGDKKSPGVAPDVDFLMPSRISSPIAWEFIDTFGIKFPRAPIIYEPAQSKR